MLPSHHELTERATDLLESIGHETHDRARDALDHTKGLVERAGQRVDHTRDAVEHAVRQADSHGSRRRASQARRVALAIVAAIAVIAVVRARRSRTVTHPAAVPSATEAVDTIARTGPVPAPVIGPTGSGSDVDLSGDLIR